MYLPSFITAKQPPSLSIVLDVVIIINFKFPIFPSQHHFTSSFCCLNLFKSTAISDGGIYRRGPHFNDFQDYNLLELKVSLIPSIFTLLTLPRMFGGGFFP